MKWITKQRQILPQLVYGYQYFINLLLFGEREVPMSTKEERLFILFMICRFLQPCRCKIIPPLGKRLFIRAVYLNISIFEGVHMKIYCCLLDGVNNSFFSRQAYTHFREEMPPKPHLLTWGPAFTKQHQISDSRK